MYREQCQRDSENYSFLHFHIIKDILESNLFPAEIMIFLSSTFVTVHIFLAVTDLH